MEKKNKTLLYVVGVLLVIAVGISLAYFAASILASGNGAKTHVNTAYIGDTYVVTEGNLEFTDTDIYPGHKNISKLKLTATGNQSVEYNLIWKGVNTLQTTLNYTLYKSTTDETPSVTCTKKSQGNLVKIVYEECTNSGFDNLEQIATGEITTSETEKVYTLKENESITATEDGTIVYYYVVLEFPNEQTSQNYDANGRFEGETNVVVPGINDPDVDMSIDDIIASLNVKEGAPDFSKIATKTENELEEDGTDNNGIFKTNDQMYGIGAKTYYWRGAATTNHVIFDNKCWRIVRINGDGSIRLIYNGETKDNDGKTCNGNGENADSVILKGTAYNSDYLNSKYVGWTYASKDSQRPSTTNPQTSGTASTIKTALEDWYSTNISASAKTKIVSGKFCNDRNTENNETWRATGTAQYYAIYGRLSTGTRTPTLSCPSGDVYELSVGMITADEVQFAGASWTTNNTSYYLYNGQDYWTMTPYSWSSPSASVCYVYSKGSLSYINANVNNANYSTRPVINLRSDTLFAIGGNGTTNNPYVVEA